MAVATFAESTRTSSRFRFPFAGRGGTLLGVYLLNVLGVVLTLGIYSFWAKVRVRRYLVSQLEVAGERFEYHGLGGEWPRKWLIGALVREGRWDEAVGHLREYRRYYPGDDDVVRRVVYSLREGRQTTLARAVEGEFLR